ncbi:MAG: signal peptide peptidase SppA [Acidobacteriota bacterium]
MGNRKLWLVLILVVVAVCLAIIVGGALIYVLHAPPAVAGGSVLQLQVGLSVRELPATDPWSQLFASQSINLWDMKRGLESAAHDDRVTAVYLEISPTTADWAQIEEMREMLHRFRASGKKVISFLAVDIATEKEVYLAAAADQVFMNPTSGFLVNGLMAQVTFMKRTLEMLHVKPDFIQFKEYKSAETYSRDQMTQPIRDMLTSLITSIQDQFAKGLSDDRNIESKALQDLMTRGLFPADVGKEAGLIDELGYINEVRAALSQAAGTEEYHGLSLGDYLDSLPEYLGPASARTRIAYVGAVGTIVTGRSESVADLLGAASLGATLRDLQHDSSISGVILRVNSPGGSAVASDMIWEEVRQLEQAGKPVIVSMSGVAGSGGYYISMPARRIVAQPSTLTGSIGVIFGKFDLSGLYKLLGMDIERIKLEPNSDIFSLTSSLSPEQQQLVKGWMAQTYQTFVSKAAEGRHQAFDAMEAKARGHVYTGAQAVDEGLVDTLGGITAAISQMKDVLGLAPSDRIRLELYPKPKSFWETLTSGNLFQISAPSLVESLREHLNVLERPGIWMLAPEVQVQ